MILDDPRSVLTTVIDNVLLPRTRTRWSYYSGDHPKAWVNTKVKEIFQGLADSLTENYCGLAVNARVSRLELEGWTGDNADLAEAIWLSSGLATRQDMMYRWGLVHGSVYLIAGLNEAGEQVVGSNPATICYGAPDPNDWAALQYAGKMWAVGAGDSAEWLMAIYDDTSVWRFRAPKDSKGKAPIADDFTADNENGPQTAHGFETIPVVAIYPFGPFSPVLIDEISPIQDRINKLGSNKFVAAEFGAFRQRVFFTRQQVDPYDLRNAPDTAIILDPGDSEAAARVQELSATDLANYDSAKDNEVDALFTIATLPRHLRVNPGSSPSGEAIKADEGPFVESLHDHQREFGQSLIRALALFGIVAEPTWRDVVVANDLASAQTVKTLVDAGMPWQLAAQRYMNLTDEDLLAAEAYSAQNQASTQSALGADLRSAVIGP